MKPTDTTTTPTPSAVRDRWNACRYRGRDAPGHYESWFQRANHPSKPLAFWIRYTVFSPLGDASLAVGELWSAYFDRERGRAIASRVAYPIARCRFSESTLDVDIAGARLDGGHLVGAAASGPHEFTWELTYRGDDAPLLLLPEAMYDRSIPRAKPLVGTPGAVYHGRLVIDGEPIEVDGWVGSQNHNWGSRHTDEYAWGQVAGFDGAPESFLECATSRLRIAAIRTPPMTMIVLRHAGREHRLNSLRQALLAKGEYRYFRWTFASSTRGLSIDGTIDAPADAFVALGYANPPGGMKTCLNTKIARCRLMLRVAGEPDVRLETQNRAAFEILTDRDDHGVTIAA